MKTGSDPAGSDPNFTRLNSAGILIDCGLFQGQDEGRGASASDLSIDFPIGHIRALIRYPCAYRPRWPAPLAARYG